MRRRQRATIGELRQAVDCLPRKTKVAMLEGIHENEIIVGAYTDGRGVCPMLAAHRAGGRTSLISFAHAWDRFGFRGARVGAARRATERELLILKTHLEASLLEKEGPNSELARAMAEHRELVASRSEDREPDALEPQRTEPDRTEPDRTEPDRTELGGPSRPGERDRTRELRRREGWAWLRVFRRYDDYQRALDRLDTDRMHVEHREPAALR